MRHLFAVLFLFPAAIFAASMAYTLDSLTLFYAVIGVVSISNLIGFVGRRGIGECDMSAFAGKTFDDGGSNSATASGDKCALIF